MDNGGPAFPATQPIAASERGMTLRDYFAAKAMQGILSHEGEWNPISRLADFSYEIADAMLKAREKNHG